MEKRKMKTNTFFPFSDATFLEGTSVRGREKMIAIEEAEAELPEVMNERAVAITKRIHNKLTGRDFSPKKSLDVAQQVDLLIKQATDIANLSHCYLGWAPYW
jgi:phosphatidylinositol kinase/protein kinase (PI-3  family)